MFSQHPEGQPKITPFLAWKRGYHWTRVRETNVYKFHYEGHSINPVQWNINRTYTHTHTHTYMKKHFSSKGRATWYNRLRES